MSYIYALLLTDSKYYITNYDSLVSIDGLNINNKNMWLNKYKMLKIDSLFENCNSDDINRITKIYATKYGIENVRNVNYPSIKLDPELTFVIKDINIKLTEGKYLSLNKGIKNYKKVWFCDYCGKDFDNFNDAYLHEKNHKQKKENTDSPCLNLCCLNLCSFCL